MLRVDSSTTGNGLAGLTLAVTLSKAGGAFASISPTVTDRGNGWYSIALTASHTDTLGDLVVRATATGAQAAERILNVVINWPITMLDLDAAFFRIRNAGTGGAVEYENADGSVRFTAEPAETNGAFAGITRI